MYSMHAERLTFMASASIERRFNRDLDAGGQCELRSEFCTHRIVKSLGNQADERLEQRRM
jgi:hypothetical protein